MFGRKNSRTPLQVTRRALGTRLLGGLAAVGLGGATQASQQPPATDPVLRDAALRGLALAGHRGDPVAAADARNTLRQLAETDPEAALLCRLYRRLDVRPSAYYRIDVPDATPEDLRILHLATAACRPVTFDYTDLEDQESTRTVLPLALVHPPQGVKLLAWCVLRDGYRQFFVRSLRNLTVGGPDFTDRRFALLEGLVEKEGA